MPPIRAPFLAMLTGLSLAACGSAGTEEPRVEDVTLTGTWRGGFDDGQYHLAAVLSVTEQDTVIGGSGFISGSGLECGVALEGARSGARIAIDLRCPGYLPIRFRGNRTSATRIAGYVQGSGLPRNDMDLVKQ